MAEARAVAVVGGGIAGLIAAIVLARDGARVRLFERAAQFGGRAQSRVVEGFVFNQGPHALYRGGAFAKALAEFGVAAPGGPPDFRHAAAVWGNKLHPLPSDFKTIARGAPLNILERFQLLRLFAALPRLDLSAWRGRTLSDFTRRLPTRLRALVHALARLTTYAHAPDGLDAAAALAQLRLGGKGVVYVDGGWGTLVEGLARAARAAGAEIRLDAQLAPIERASNGWLLIEHGRDEFTAEAVILATPPSAATALLPSSAALAQAVRQARPVRTISLDLGLRRLPDAKATFALGVDKPLYFSVHSAGAQLAPAGGALLHAARYLAPDEPAGAEGLGEVSALIERLQPGFEKETLQSAKLIAMPVAYDFPQAQRAGRMAPVSLEDAPGVFLAGDWVGEGAMLSDAAAKSAREAAASALAYVDGRARPRATVDSEVYHT